MAGTPLILWAIIGLAMAGFNYAGERYDQQQKIANYAFNEKERDDFVRNGKRSCTMAQQQSDINRKIGATNQQVDVYCTCVIDALSKMISLDEIKQMALTGTTPSSLQEKGLQAAPRCSNLAFGR
jgi:hypothetical protein